MFATNPVEVVRLAIPLAVVAVRADLAAVVHQVAVVHRDASDDLGGTTDATITPQEQQARAPARTGKETP